MKQILPILVVAILLAGCKPIEPPSVELNEVVFETNQETTTNGEEVVADNSQEVTEATDALVEKENIQEVANQQIEQKEQVAEVAQKPKYTAYSQSQYDALLGKKPFALFFHAPWCHICRGMEEDILANLSSFADGTVILKADYDTETELKKKYGIRSQSVIVLIDASGKVVETLVAPTSTELKSSFAGIL